MEPTTSIALNIAAAYDDVATGYQISPSQIDTLEQMWERNRDREPDQIRELADSRLKRIKEIIRSR